MSKQLLHICRKLEAEALLCDMPDLASRIKEVQGEYGNTKEPVKHGLALRYIAARELHAIKTEDNTAKSEFAARKNQARVAPEEAI